MRFFVFTLVLLIGLSACSSPRTVTNTMNPVVRLKAGRSVVIQPGETLYSFARRNNASMREIIDLNRLQAPYQLTPGASLALPISDHELPSVELGPIAYENENAYKQKHAGKAVTTYTQIVPEPKAQAVPDKNDVLQEQARLQFAQQKRAEPTTAATLKLQPLHFDKKNKQLVEKPKLALPEKTVEVNVGKVEKKPEKKAKIKLDPSENVEKTNVVSEKPVERQKELVLHSRIEKPAEPVNFIWPVQGTVISTFGPKSNGLKNDGINIGVPRGTPVVAADGGTVAYAGSDIPGYGNVVLVRHPSGLMTTYAHLERMFVQQDIIVAKGDLLGTVGTSGGLDTPQLHFEIRRDKEALDPAKYLYR